MNRSYPKLANFHGNISHSQPVLTHYLSLWWYKAGFYGGSGRWSGTDEVQRIGFFMVQRRGNFSAFAQEEENDDLLPFIRPGTLHTPTFC